MAIRLCFLSIFFLTVFSEVLFSQAEYLDASFGDNGTLEFTTHDSVKARIHMIEIDHQGSLYCSYMINKAGHYEGGIKKWSATGKEESTLYSKSTTNSVINYYLKNNGIVKLTIGIGDSTNVDRVIYEVQDLSSNRSNVFELPKGNGITTSHLFGYRGLYMDSNERLVTNTTSGLVRYLDGYTRDQDFGEAGLAAYHPQDTLSISYYTRFGDYLYESADGSILASYLGREKDDSILATYNYNLIKYNSAGEIDGRFGDGGKVKLSSDLMTWDIDDFKEGYLLHIRNFSNEFCSSNNDVIAIDSMGNLDDSFGRHGSLHEIDMQCSESIWWTQIGPDDELMSIVTDLEIDESQPTDYFDREFRKYNSLGILDTSFADQGKLKLDLFEGHGIYDVIMDEDYSIYILHGLYNDTIFPQYKYISKFDGKKLWNIEQSSSPSGRFLVFPNPSSSVVMLGYEGAPQVDLEISLIDVNGKRIFSQDLLALVNQDIINLSNHDLAAGTYFLKVRNADGASLFDVKVIVVR